MAEKKIVSVQNIYDGYADKSRKEVSNGKAPYKVDVNAKYDVEFIKDFKKCKVGQVLKGIGVVAFDLYKANGVVKEI